MLVCTKISCDDTFYIVYENVLAHGLAVDYDRVHMVFGFGGSSYFFFVRFYYLRPYFLLSIVPSGLSAGLSLLLASLDLADFLFLFTILPRSSSIFESDSSVGARYLFFVMVFP